MWKRNSRSDYIASADGGGVIYRLADWSSKITYKEIEEDKDDARTATETDNPPKKEEDKVDAGTELETVNVPNEGW